MSTFREHRWCSHDGLALYSRIYDSAGSTAPAVLCLAGLTRNSRDFEGLALHLAARYRVVCPDLRGRGHSQRDPQWRNYHPGTYLTDIASLLESLQLTEVAVVGTSLGGLLAMLLASVEPQRIAGIVLNDVGPEADPRGLERIRSYAGKLPPVRTWDEAIAQCREVNGASLPDVPDAQWPVLARRWYREDASGIPVLDCDPMVGEAVRAASPVPGGLWSVFAQVRAVPMLAIRGALSDILSEAILARMQREKPDLQTLIVARRGHVPLLEEPEVVPVIDRFLDALAPFRALQSGA